MLESSKEQPKPARAAKKVRWGWWIGFSLMALIFLSLAFLPGIPVVREWILTYAKTYVEKVGYTLDYQKSEGNLWRGFRLGGVHLQGQGQDVALESIKLDYFLPALITGELPLSIAAKGLSGDINVKTLRIGTSITPNEENVLPIRIKLKEVDLADIAIQASDVPFTLPNFSLGNLQIESKGEGLHFVTTVSTVEGSADIEGDLGLAPFALEADISRADVTIARQWWEGIEAGTTTGHVSVQDGQVRAQAKISDAQIHFLNEVVTGIQGEGTLEFPKIRATVTGEALGGTVQATGGVDIDKSNWFADFDGDVDLKEAGVWLAEGRLPFPLDTWPITGRAQTKVKASGWVDVNVEGQAVADGTLASLPLKIQQSEFSVNKEGVNVTALGSLANGPLIATFKPEDQGIVFDLGLQDAKVLPFATADATATIRSQPGVTEGESSIDLGGRLWGRDFKINAEGLINADGWQNFITGLTSLDEPIDGAVVLNSDLEGQINIKQVRVPGASELLELNLAVSGPPTSLPLTLTIAAPEVFNYDIAGVTFPIQGGKATGLLEIPEIKNIQGTLGPINIQGGLSLNGQDAELALSAQDIPLSGRLESELDILSGNFLLQEGKPRVDLQVQTTDIKTSGVTLASIVGNATVALDDGLLATLTSPTLDVTYQKGEVSTTLKDTRAKISNQDFVLSGTAQVRPEDLGTLSADISASSSLAEISLRGQNGQLAFEAKRQDEFPFDIQGSVDVLQNAVDFSGTLMDANVKGTASLQEALQADILLEQGDEALSVTVTGTLQDPELNAKGSLAADVLEPILNIPLSGTLQVDITRRAGELSGSATLEGTISDIPVDLELIGQGNNLTLQGTATPLGQELDLSGVIDVFAEQPTVDITATGEIGTFELTRSEDGFNLQGQGVTPTLNAGGLDLAGQPWQLSGPIDDLSLSVGGSKVAIRQADGLSASGTIEQVFIYQGIELLLEADTTITPKSSSVDGTLTITTPTQEAVFPVSGSLDALNIGGTISAQELVALAKVPIEVAGDIELNGTLSLLEEQPSYNFKGNWQTSGASLPFELSGQGSAFEITAQNKNLSARYSPQGLELSATSFDPSSFLISPKISGLATGQMTWLNGRWSGAMAYESRVPVQAKLNFNGLVETVGVTADYTNQGIKVHASGEAFPNVSLNIEGSYQDLATVNGHLKGTPAQPIFEGVLTTKEITQTALGLFIPAQQFSVSNDGLKALLTNEGSSLSVDQQGLSGKINLPFMLNQQAHYLDLDLSGALNTLSAKGQVSGDSLQGSLDFSQNILNADVFLDPNNYLKEFALGVPIDSQPFHITFQGDRDLNWKADILGQGQLDKLPTDVSLSLSGQGLNYQAEGGLRLNGQLLPIKVSGQGRDIQLKADFDYFPLEVFEPYVASQGEMRGYVKFDSRKPQPLELQLSATGQVANQPFSLNADLNENQSLRINITQGNASILIEPKTAKQYEFTVALPELSKPFLLKGNLDIADAISLKAEGQIDLEPLSVQATFNPSSFQGDWLVRLADSTLTGNIARLEDDLVLQSQLEVLPNSLIATPLSATFQAQSINNIWNLETLQFSSPLATGQLTGQAFPDLDISGRLELPALSPIDVHLQGVNGYQLDLVQEGLKLSSVWSSLTLLESAHLQGAGALASFGNVVGDLSWQRETGFTGNANLDLVLPNKQLPLHLYLKAIGQGTLELSGNVSTRDLQMATLGLTVPADASTVTGRIAVDADLAGLYGLEQPLLLKSDIDVSGMLLHLGLMGPVQVSGALNATGQVTVPDLLREGRLELTGDIMAVANYNSEGYNLKATTQDLDISALLPQLETPILSSTLSITPSENKKLLVQGDGQLKLNNSLVLGNIYYDKAWQGQIDLDANLADIHVAALPLQGVLKGIINVGSSLDGNVSVSALNWGEADAYLDGQILVSGSLTSPVLRANLSGSGNASGDLLLNVENQAMTLQSNVRSPNFSSDVNIALQPDSVQGQGFINVAGYQFTLEPSESSLHFVGQEKLLGWQMDFDVSQRAFNASGTLDSVNKNVQGQVQLSFDQEAGLKGSLQGISLGNLFLGDAVISSAANFISITGDAITAQLDTANQTWKIDRLHLGSNNVILDLAGLGTFSNVQLEGSLQSDLLTKNVVVPIAVEYSDQTLKVQSQGGLPEGYIEILAQATPQAGWQGSIKIRTFIQKVQADIQGVIEGGFASPEAFVTTVITRDDIQTSGNIRVGLQGINLEQNISAGQLKNPVSIMGSLFPLDLTLASAGKTLHLLQQDQLVAQGNLDLQWGDTTVGFNAKDAGLELVVALPLPGLALSTQLSELSVNALTRSLQEGMLWQGQQQTTGSLLIGLQEGLFVQLEDLKYQNALGALSLSGGVRQDGGWQGQIVGTWQGTGQDSDWLPWLSSLNRVDINLLLEEKDIALIMQSEAGSINARLNLENTEALLRADVALGSGQLGAYINYDELGPSGEITLTEVPLYRDLRLSSSLIIDPTAIGGRANIDIGQGQLRLEGSLGLASVLPISIVPQGSQSQQLSLRIDNVKVQNLPYLQGRLPYLESTLSAFARLQNQRWVGQLSSSNLKVLEKNLPLALEFNGLPTALELRGTLGRSTFNANVDTSHAEGLLSFEQFPLESLVEAAVGETGTQGVLWGAMRFDIPWNDPRQGYIRFASEKIVLGPEVLGPEDAQTQGNLSFRIEKGGLVIDQALFEGDGRWQATGQLTPEVMDFQISAREANFTPLLLLFPQLASIGFGASGSLEFSAQGSFASPKAKLISPALDVSIGGSSYRLQETLINLKQGRLTAQSQLIGLKPIGGNLTLISQGTVQLNPAQANLTFQTSGSANIPALGEVEDIDATISSTVEAPWFLDLKGRLGQPFSIQGSLAPLDVRLQGQDLNLRAPERFLDSSQADVDMRLRYEQGLILSGSILTDLVNIKLGTQQQSPPDPAATKPAPNRFLERVFFDSIVIQAPQQITFDENFGAGELRADVVLTGTAAHPELSGEASSLRGELNFSGRRFTINNVVADFQPSRGIYPNLSIGATASFEKSTALRGNGDVSFTEPSGPNFEVFLNFTGELLAKEGGGFSADLNPSLSSNAIISTSSGQRTLTENELFSLITLGNFQLAETITGEGSVAESVAQGALDTAVDYFILSELQTQLGEALGLDLFEVRTTALSSILAGTQSFGVALRIGGYLRDDLFASYEIRTLDLEPDVAFSNEFSLRYDFSPLELDLVGRLNILRQASFTPSPELSIGLGYAVSPLLRVQGSVDISQQEQSVRFGISLRW